MESNSDASREELIETIEFLKEENEKTVDELMKKLRSIEGEQLKTNISNRQMEGKIRELKGEINSFKKTPLILATVTEVFDDNGITLRGTDRKTKYFQIEVDFDISDAPAGTTVGQFDQPSPATQIWDLEDWTVYYEQTV